MPHSSMPYTFFFCDQLFIVFMNKDNTNIYIMPYTFYDIFDILHFTFS